MAKVRGGISERKYFFYGLIILIFLGLNFYLSPLFLVFLATGFLMPLLYVWSATGGAYRAFISSYTGHPKTSSLQRICNTALINVLLILARCEELSVSAVTTIGMALKTLRPSLRQKHRWNRSLEEVIYSDAKVDYRGRVRDGTVPDFYDFSFRGTTAGPRTEPQSNASETLGPQAAEVFQKLKELLAESS